MIFRPERGTKVFEQILQRMREKVRKRQYVMTLHAEEENKRREQNDM